jgi:hypothetical protein
VCCSAERFDAQAPPLALLAMRPLQIPAASHNEGGRAYSCEILKGGCLLPILLSSVKRFNFSLFSCRLLSKRKFLDALQLLVGDTQKYLSGLRFETVEGCNVAVSLLSSNVTPISWHLVYSSPSGLTWQMLCPLKGGHGQYFWVSSCRYCACSGDYYRTNQEPFTVYAKFTTCSQVMQ